MANGARRSRRIGVRFVKPSQEAADSSMLKRAKARAPVFIRWPPGLFKAAVEVAGDVGIDAGEDEVGPAFAEFVPERAGFAPGGQLDAAAVRQVFLKNRSRLVRQRGIFQAEHQLV